MDYINADDPIKKLMMVFMSSHGAWVMARAEELFMDGTFDTRPKFFAQIYFIRAKMAGKCCVPVAYILLPNKDSATYRKMWEVLMSLVNFEPGHPTRITTDFERAAYNTLRETFPLAKLTGCYFHFKQAVYRNLQQKGLESLHNQNPSFQYLVSLLYGLAMVPANKIPEYYDTVVQDYLESQEEKPEFQDHQEEISAFLSYFERTWLGVIAGRNRTRRAPLISIGLWSKHEAVVGGYKLTNNTCEGANSAWAATIGPHPTLSLVVDKFISSETWAQKVLREESLAVGRQDQSNSTRSLAATHQRKDLQALCTDFPNVEPNVYMDTLINFY